ncbi:unnamed protein product [Arctogadus glacialis]
MCIWRRKRGCMLGHCRRPVNGKCPPSVANKHWLSSDAYRISPPPPATILAERLLLSLALIFPAPFDSDSLTISLSVLSPFCPFPPLSVLSTSLSFSLSSPPFYRSLLFSVFSTSLSLSLHFSVFSTSLSLSPSCHSQAVFCKSSLLFTSVRLSVGMGNASYIQGN